MELHIGSVYGVIGGLLLCHVLYLLIRRRVQARHLPPKYWTFDPFVNLDWIFTTSLNGDKFIEFQTKLGKTYRMPTLFNPMHAVSTCDPENMQAVMAGKDWGVGFRLDGMGELLGRGIITTDGEEWFRARKMLRPGFNRNNVDDFAHLDNVIQGLLRKIPGDGETVDMGPLFYDTFLDTSLKFILGIDARDQNDGRPVSTETFNQLWLDGLVGMGLRLLLGSMRFLAPKAHYAKACATVHSFVDFAIDKAEERLLANAVGKTKSAADILLSQTSDRKYAQAQLLQGILGNQDTTSVLCSNVVQLLAEHPEIWARLRKEVKESDRELLTYDGLRENRLIQNILLESLRLRPVFPVVARRALRPTVLPTGGGPNGDQPLPVPAGTTGMVNFYSLNLDTAVFGADARSFNPDRWLNVKPSGKEFMPFGTGPRSCLGKDKALAEAGYLLVRLVERFERVEGRSGKGAGWRPEVRISMKNKAGYKVAFWRAEEA